MELLCVWECQRESVVPDYSSSGALFVLIVFFNHCCSLIAIALASTCFEALLSPSLSLSLSLSLSRPWRLPTTPLALPPSSSSSSSSMPSPLPPCRPNLQLPRQLATGPPSTSASPTP